MSVPKSFQLINRRWKVKLVSTQQLQEVIAKTGENWDPETTIKGLSDFQAAVIYINTDEAKSEDDVQHTYWHEVSHALLYAMGHLDHDEVAVDLQGALLAQYFQTVRGEQDC